VNSNTRPTAAKECEVSISFVLGPQFHGKAHTHSANRFAAPGEDSPWANVGLLQRVLDGGVHQTTAAEDQSAFRRRGNRIFRLILVALPWRHGSEDQRTQCCAGQFPGHLQSSAKSGR
jgi:hypothetical protein